MLAHDPAPWLIAQDGLPALRARRRLDIDSEGDAQAVGAHVRALARAQQADGSFAGSPMRTAGTLVELADLRAVETGQPAQALVEAGASYLLALLLAQPGYAETAAAPPAPGSLAEPCDLCGFFGPYSARARPEVVAHGAREMNAYREFEPLLGPTAPVREAPRSSRDRAGPSSCYAWGLIPLSYTVEALCRTGYARDPRLQPAIHALLGAQRESGGWCRNLGGHIGCTLYAVRALGAHPDFRRGTEAEHVLQFIRQWPHGWRGKQAFAILQAVAAFDLPTAHDMLRDGLSAIAPRQRRDGTFGTPHRVERVAAVLTAFRTLKVSEDL
jgi:hypothetical protein